MARLFRFSPPLAALLLVALTASMALMLVALTASTTLAAVTPEQRKQATRVKTAVRKATRLLDDGKAREAADVVREAQKQVESLLGDKPGADVVRLVEPVLAPLAEVHSLVELEGISLPALPLLPEMAAPAKPGTPTPGTPPAASNGLSFAGQVAPLLVARCGKCHVDQTKGKVSMANFAALMRGSPDDGPVILPGNGVGSRIVEVIESGDMPRGGGKIARPELALLVKWIDEGAKFDGGNPNTGLRQLKKTTAAAPAPKTPPPTVARATGNETVRFGRDIAPVLVAQCNGCHGENRPRADFSLATFQGLLKGGDSGTPVIAGKPADSLLVKKLKGEVGDRMPLDKPPLPPDVISNIETWIAEGARLDALDAKATLTRIAAVVQAELATPDELARIRSEQADRNWALAIPDDQARTHESEQFLVVGNVGENTLADVARRAEKQAAAVATALKLPAGKKLLAGQVTIFVFRQRYDYTEFGTMVEKRQLPSVWRGHWHYDPVAPYVAILPPSGDAYSTDALLAQLLASLHVAGKKGGDVPRWLSEGLGRAVAAKLGPKDPRVAAWDEEVPQALSRMEKPDDFMARRLAPEDGDVLSYSFGSRLLSSSSRLGKLLGGLDGGSDLDAVLKNAYGGTALQLAGAWARTAGRR